MSKIENEIKIRLEYPESTILQLREAGAIFEGVALERTTRVDTEDKTLERKGIFLRVRDGFSNTITMKEKVGEDTTIKKRFETEFEIEDIDKMINIFKRIGLTYLCIMEKYRMRWLYQNTIITIDELPFGIYMEIEGEEQQILQIKKSLMLDDQPSIIETYWKLNEQFNPNNPDITFPAGYEFVLMKFKECSSNVVSNRLSLH